MGQMFLLGKKGGTQALPPDGTAWIIMPDGLTYEVRDLRFGMIGIETTAIPVEGEPGVSMITPTGKPQIQFSGVAVERERIKILDANLPQPEGKTRFITFD